MADRPAVRTVPNVELIEVGTWPASTGEVTWVPDDIAAAVAAQDDPSYNTPIVKLGHVDARFDGNPALGRIINMRASDDGQTLIGDLAGVPTWLADLIDGQREDPEGANAYPFRSIEGSFGFTTAAGRHHRFVVTALALLGDTFPAVSTLADIATVYGLDPVEVAASAAASLQEVIVAKPPNTVRAASVEVEQVRNAFYAADYADQVGMWAWVRTVLMGTDGDPNAVIVDDDEGSLWSVPWSVDTASRAVSFDWEAKQRKGIEYVDLADPPETEAVAAAAGALRSRIAHMVQTSTTAPPNTTTPPGPTVPAAQPAGQEGRESDPVAFELNDEQVAALRTRLGLADDATPEQVAAALMAAPGPDDGAGTNTDQARMQIPAGAVLVDAAQLEELQRGAQQGVEANRRLRNSDRDQQIAAAVTDGKISRARVEHWTAAWDKDPEGIRDTLAAMPKNLIPVTAGGYTPGASDDDIDAEFASIFPPKAGD